MACGTLALCHTVGQYRTSHSTRYRTFHSKCVGRLKHTPGQIGQLTFAVAYRALPFAPGSGISDVSTGHGVGAYGTPAPYIA
eukprot:3937703-Rhodomonas_salina.2